MEKCDSESTGTHKCSLVHKCLIACTEGCNPFWVKLCRLFYSNICIFGNGAAATHTLPRVCLKVLTKDIVLSLDLLVIKFMDNIYDRIFYAKKNHCGVRSSGNSVLCGTAV